MMKAAKTMLAGALALLPIAAMDAQTAPASVVPQEPHQEVRPDARQGAPVPAQLDTQVDVAAEYVGRALFLRCFCAENTLRFDGQGRVAGMVKEIDWTLAAVNVQKVERLGPGFIGLEGVRVAIRYAPDRHEFERHAQNEEKVRLQIGDTGDARQFERALERVFSVGIDLPLQRSMPDYWKHYFAPALPWDPDDLAAQPVYVPGPAGALVGAPPNAKQPAQAGPPVSAPTPTHKVEPEYSGFAQHDRVRGTVQLRLVVDAEGVPRHVAIAQPLGYGLDARAVAAVKQYRFTPAMRDGKAVAAAVSVNQEFVVVNAPR